ncbi:MAG TPA: hypothetical protein V6D09_15625 [Leptolyngbyaceae cyanobacterium]
MGYRTPVAIQLFMTQYLPPYCCQMNPIETEWHQLKPDEIAGQMFADEYDARYGCDARHGSAK